MRLILLMMIVFLCSCAKIPTEPISNQSTVEYFNTTTFTPEPPQSYGYDETNNWTTWNKVLFGFALAGQGADVVSSVHQTNGPYCREGNYKVYGTDPTAGLLIAVKSVVLIGGYLIIEYVYKGDPNQQVYRNILGGVMGVAGFAYAKHNMSLDCY